MSFLSWDSTTLQPYYGNHNSALSFFLLFGRLGHSELWTRQSCLQIPILPFLTVWSWVNSLILPSSHFVASKIVIIITHIRRLLQLFNAVVYVMITMPGSKKTFLPLYLFFFFISTCPLQIPCFCEKLFLCTISQSQYYKLMNFSNIDSSLEVFNSYWILSTIHFFFIF